MNIPAPYIFQIETPTILFSEHLFQPGNETRNNINFLNINGKKFDLSEIASPNVLEELYFENNKKLFEQYKQDFISKSMNKMYLSTDTIETELRNNVTLRLIVKDILPVITAVKIDNQMDAALADKVYTPKDDMKDIFSNISRSPGRLRTSNNTDVIDKTKDELIRNIKAAYANIGTSKQKKYDLEGLLYRELTSNGKNPQSLQCMSPSEPSILTDELLGDINILFAENRAYDLLTIPKLMSEFKDKINDSYFKELSKFDSSVNPSIIIDSIKKNYDQISTSSVSRIINKLRSTNLNINGEFYFPIYYNESAPIISDYKKLIEKRLRIDSINHTQFQEESLRKIAEEKSQLSKLVDTNKLEINGAGFEKIGNSYYVFITTSEYVLKSPHDKEYYRFGKAKIGLEIIASGRNSIEIREPLVLNEYKHPFLSGYSSKQKICMGVYKTDSARRLPPGQAVLTILTKAQENLMMGYKTGDNPHNRLDYDHFGAYRITKQEFVRSGLACLNDYKR